MNNIYQNQSSRLGSILAALVLVLIASIPFAAKAQVLQAESFESTIFPPPGWKQFKAVSAATGAFARQLQSAATNPTVPVAPGGGLNLMMYNSATASVNDSSFMISKPFDFSSAGASIPTFSFQMYRDAGFPGNLDQIIVYVNTVPSQVGATPVNHGAGSNIINRPNTAFPAVTVGWHTYTFTVPPAFVNGPLKTYVIIVGKAAGGLNMYLDDFRSTTFPSPTVTGDVSMTVVQQNFASVGTGTTNQWVIGVRCVVAGGSGCGNVALGTAVKLDSMFFNTNGTTNVNDIQNAKVWYTGGSQQFSTAYISPFPALAGNRYPTANFGLTIPVPTTDLDFWNVTNCFHLEYDTTYFWLTYDIKAAAQGGNFVDGDFRGAAITPGGGACPTPGGNPTTVPVTPSVADIPGGSQIDIPYCVPTYTTGTKWANYTNNDYVSRVEFLTAVAPSFINTFINSPSVQDPAAPGCGPPQTCPFAGHPPDYELRPTSGPYGGYVILTQGNSYAFRAQVGTWASSNYLQAWIDYNRNGVFETTERCVATPTSLPSLGWQNFVANVPAAGYTGTTRMRVREVFANSNIDPCANYTFGECEDFSVTILPNCPAGYKLWLGNTSNWADPANWCGGVPTSSDDARIERAVVPGLTGPTARSYYPPIISSGVQANTRGLFISAQDTLFIDAPNPFTPALKVHANIEINGRLEAKGGYTSTVTIANGTIDNNIYTPFRGSVTDARCQILYSAAELTARGLVANDRITQIGFNIATKNSTQPYNGFSITYGFQPAGTTQFATNNPVATPFVAHGPVAFSTVIGGNTVTLTNPIVWDGTSALVIQYCFDNPSTTGNDLIKITQTTLRKTVLLLTSSAGTPGCALVPGAGVSDNFFGSAGINRPNFTFTIDRTYLKPIIGLKGDWNLNGIFVPGTSQVSMDSAATQLITGTVNTSFHELNINKNAITNSVVMSRPVTVQDTLWMTQGRLELNRQTLTIENTSWSGNPGGNNITPIVGPISRTNGLIISEDSLSKVNWVVGTVPFVNPAGFYRFIPFGTNLNSYIPFTFRHATGDLGTFSVATYGTPAPNTPWPPTVSHMNDSGVVATNNSLAAVDRFWITQKGNNAAVADLVFRWATPERPTAPLLNGFSNPGRAYPWRVSPNNMGAWLKTYNAPVNPLTQATAAPYVHSYGLNGAAGAVFDSVRVIAFDWPNVLAGGAPWNATAGPMPNYLPWSVAGSSAAGALPVELLSFTARQVGSKVQLNWNTAAEINNDYFTVERSDKDQYDFSFIAKVNSWMNNSSFPLFYEAWDEKPLHGLQYYRLKQTDLDGQFTYHGPVPVDFDASRLSSLPFEVVNTYADQLATGLVNVEFSYNSELPVSYFITDATGRIVANGNGVAATPGLNRITINQSLTRGMYIVTIRNEKEAVSRRFVY